MATLLTLPAELPPASRARLGSVQLTSRTTSRNIDVSQENVSGACCFPARVAAACRSRCGQEARLEEHDTLPAVVEI